MYILLLLSWSYQGRNFTKFLGCQRLPCGNFVVCGLYFLVTEVDQLS